MGRFFALVKNEYIKNLKKVSAIIMLIIIVLAAFGLSGIGALSNRFISSYEAFDDNNTGDYTADNEWLEETKPEGYELDIKLNNYLEQKEIPMGSWEYEFAYEIRQNYDESILFPVLDGAIGGGDWKTSCRTLLDNSIYDAEKWEYQYRLDNEIPFGDTWQDDIISNVAAAKTTIQAIGDNKSQDAFTELKNAEETEKIGLYRLENNISENTADEMSAMDMSDGITFWSVLFQSASLVSLIGLLIIVIAGGSIASEFSQGTIKFLLINPVKRWKILMAKYFTVISIGYIMLAILFIVMIPAAGAMVGFDGFTAPYIYVSGGEVHEISSFLQMAKLYLLNSVEIIVMATFAFALSSLFKSAALAIGTSVFLMLSGSFIVTLLSQFRQDWARYLIFANTNLADIYNGQSLFPQHSLTFALIVIAAHMVVFLLTAWDGFTKREC